MVEEQFPQHIYRDFLMERKKHLLIFQAFHFHLKKHQDLLNQLYNMYLLEVLLHHYDESLYNNFLKSTVMKAIAAKENKKVKLEFID